MTNVLTRLFVGKNQDVNDPKIRKKFASLAGFTGIFVNVLLFIGKLVMGILSASVSLIADAFNNISDAGSAIITLIGFRLAGKPVDKEHPLGHGRFEYITGFIVDMLIILVGFELFKSSIERINNPSPLTAGNVTLIIIGVAVLMKIWLFFFYSKIGKKINSSALKGSALDSLTDCIATTLVFISIVVARVWNVNIDGWAGLLVASFILFAGIKASKETIDLLLGSTPDPAFVADIYAFVKAYPSIVGIHDVMVHDYGVGRQIVSFHAEVPDNCDINLAHEEIDKLERDMFTRFGCIVTVHLDPIVLGDEQVNTMRALAEDCAKEVDERFSIHDFRMTKGETTVNLIFDLVIPTDCKLKTCDAEKLVAQKIYEKQDNCFCVIRAEHPFI